MVVFTASQALLFCAEVASVYRCSAKNENGLRNLWLADSESCEGQITMDMLIWAIGASGAVIGAIALIAFAVVSLALTLAWLLS